MKLSDPFTLQEKQKYEKMWQQDPYRATSPGYLAAQDFLTFFEKRLQPSDLLIDFGCGTGMAAIPFLQAGLNVSLVDIAENCLSENIETLKILSPERIQFFTSSLWELPKSLPSSDWIYCIDVLEHLPPEKVEPSLKGMAQRTKKGGALQVFLIDEGMGRMIGETLHLTLRPLAWWTEKISSYWEIEKIETILPGIRYCIYVGPSKEGL